MSSEDKDSALAGAEAGAPLQATPEEAAEAAEAAEVTGQATEAAEVADAAGAAEAAGAAKAAEAAEVAELVEEAVTADAAGEVAEEAAEAAEAAADAEEGGEAAEAVETGEVEPPVVPPPRRQLPNLPISDQYEDIKRAVEEQRVVVIVGGTGCGKSTQVPQYILDEAAAQGHEAHVLVTQPRRMAAVTLARRVAEERGEQVGDKIGYRIRGEVMPGSQLSFATAGYLLSWLTVEPEAFANVTHIVLDEAHERDAQFELLILLVRLLMRIYSGPRLILMSATIESSFFSKYFQEFAYPRGTPLLPLTVGSRRFPVEVYFLDQLAKGMAPTYRELPMEISMAAAGCMWEIFGQKADDASGSTPALAVDEVRAKVYQQIESLALEMIPAVAEAGTTILIFVPGYADLCRLHSKLYWNLPMETVEDGEPAPPKPGDLHKLHEAEELAELTELEEVGELGGLPKPAKGAADSDEDEGLPEEAPAQEAGKSPRAYRLFALHSQVASEDQELVLERPPPGVCHLVLATTIAESSVTLPEVSGVVDFGVHRTTCHDPSQGGLTQLRTQWCARSSLVQREGRTGRTRPGWCIRMVPQNFFEDSIPAHNTPEVLRTPLTKLLLQAKGISDGLTKAVQGDEQARKRLRLQATTPGELLMQLPAPPQRDAIEAAVHELSELGVLTHESDSAEVTALGRIALWLPLDVRLCRLVWLGSLWGCVAEAVVLAAACSTGTPFQAPSRLAFSNIEDFNDGLMRSAESRRFFDGGHFSEPLMCLRLFCSWARRLGLVSRGLFHQKKWFSATASLVETAAVDPGKMSMFVSYVADVALRARDMCSDERGENASRVREDLHRLIVLMRRPDLSYTEQREKQAELPPRIGEVFTAPASKLYALMAAAFSDQLLIGSHRYTGVKSLEPMLDALDGLPRSGIASSDAILLPANRILQKNKLSTDEDIRRIIKKICGEEPEDIFATSAFVACSFKRQDDGGVPAWLRDVDLAKRSSSHMTAGLPAVESARLLDLALRPRLSFMSAGGLRKFTIEDADFFRTVSPYELQFRLVSGNKRSIMGIFAEQNPLGFACHITSPAVPLGADQFAAVTSNLTAGQIQAEQIVHARANNVTLLTAEELVYTLTTLCASSMNVSFGFVRGPGGSKDEARAALAGIKLGRYSKPVMFRKHVSGMATLDLVNEVRSALVRNLLSPLEKNSHGQEVLLWEDAACRDTMQALIDRIEAAQRFPELEELNIAQSAEKSAVWVTHTEHTAKRQKGQDTDEEGDDAGKMTIEALGQFYISHDKVERRVAEHSIKGRTAADAHLFECPDCGERFMDWAACLSHYEDTCHLDVSSERAIEEAKELSKPVLFECPECGEGFGRWHDCKLHLEKSGHLSWANTSIWRQLCLPPDFEALQLETEEAEEQVEEAATAPPPLSEPKPEASGSGSEADKGKGKANGASKQEEPAWQQRSSKAVKKEKKEQKEKKEKKKEKKKKDKKQEGLEFKSKLIDFFQKLLRRTPPKGAISYRMVKQDSGGYGSEVSFHPLEFGGLAGLETLSFSGSSTKSRKLAEHAAAKNALDALEVWKASRAVEASRSNAEKPPEGSEVPEMAESLQGVGGGAAPA